MVARDDDVGLNALIKYRFKHDLFGNYKSFAIDQNSGLITLRVPLDREKQKLYEVFIFNFLVQSIFNDDFKFRFEWKHTTREFPKNSPQTWI